MLATALVLGGFSLAAWSAWSMVDRYRPHWLGKDKAPGIQVAGGQYGSKPLTYDAGSIVNAHLFGQTAHQQAAPVQEAPHGWGRSRRGHLLPFRSAAAL